MFERAWPGNAVLFGRLADDNQGHTPALGYADEGLGHLQHLRDAPRSPIGFGRGKGLHRVDHEQGRCMGLNVADDRGQFGLFGHEQRRCIGPDAGGTYADLLG